MTGLQSNHAARQIIWHIIKVTKKMALRNNKQSEILSIQENTEQQNNFIYNILISTFFT